jgi:hypothetical protein
MDGRKIARMSWALTVGFLLASSALAHHGWTGYDETKTLNLTGTIVESGYDNPHAFVRLKVDSDGGKVWTAILAPPTRMHARGLEKESIKTGTTATVVGYPNRSKPDELRAERIVIENKSTELR